MGVFSHHHLRQIHDLHQIQVWLGGLLHKGVVPELTASA